MHMICDVGVPNEGDSTAEWLEKELEGGEGTSRECPDGANEVTINPDVVPAPTVPEPVNAAEVPDRSPGQEEPNQRGAQPESAREEPSHTAQQKSPGRQLMPPPADKSPPRQPMPPPGERLQSPDCEAFAVRHRADTRVSHPSTKGKAHARDHPRPARAAIASTGKRSPKGVPAKKVPLQVIAIPATRPPSKPQGINSFNHV